MDLELLRTFLAAVDGPSLSAVAAKRHVTKSAISQQLKSLEGQIGLPLFERAGRSLRPTEPAQALAATLRGAFTTIDDALEAMRDAYGTPSGLVRLGGPRPFTAAFLRPRLARILDTHPELVLDVTFGTPSELEAKLLARELDLAVLAREPESESLTSELLYLETFEAVASRAYLAKRGKPKTAEDLAEHRFVVFDRDLAMHAPWWRATFGSRAAMRGRIVALVASLDEMLAIAASGNAIAVLPDYFVKQAVRDGVVERLRFDGSARARPAKNGLVLVWRRGIVDTARLRAVRAALTKPH